jgi:hypothetical protein
MRSPLLGGIAALAVLMAGCSGEAATADRSAAPAPSPTPVVEATTEPPAAPVSAPDPAPTPDPTVDPDEARLTELRASDAFEALAEHERAQTAEWARFAWDEFTLSTNAEGVREEWTNKAELWDELMPPIRDECLLAGDEATEPMWTTELMIPTGVTPRWSDEATRGRGQFMEVVCAFTDGDGPTTERWYGFLIKTRDSGAGDVVATMPPFDVSEADHGDLEQRTSALRRHLWDWIISEAN